MEYPDNWSLLSKHEHKEFKRTYFHEQQKKLQKTLTYKKYSIYTLLSLTLMGVGYLFVKEVSRPQPGEYVASLGNKHIQNITDVHDLYNSIPPTSGAHVGGKANWGISDSPIPDELQLHNLEDKGVGIQYNCSPNTNTPDPTTPSAVVKDSCNQLIAKLAEIAKKYPNNVFMAPYPKLDTKIALTAWSRIDKFNDFDSERIHLFINAYKGIDHH